MKPLVSILIPAYNAQQWIADSLRSAIGQSWEPKEIIVIDDGSSDRTAEIARRFQSQGVRVVSQKNRGAAVSRNAAFALSRGKYIQWLDADDIISPNKVSRQMEMLQRCSSKRVLASSAWGQFFYRYYRARLKPSALWRDLSPAEFLMFKMSHNVFMPNSAWLVSRELTEAAGPWNPAMSVDDDGEYFCRVLLASEGVRFVPEATVYYRASGPGSLSQIGSSDTKLESQWQSLQLHVHYLLKLENTERARSACVKALQDWLVQFYPARPDIVQQQQELARTLGGQLQPPRFPWKYAWLKALFGWEVAKKAQNSARQLKWAVAVLGDKLLFRLERRTRKAWQWPDRPTQRQSVLRQISNPLPRTEKSPTGQSEPTQSAATGHPLVSILIPAFNCEEWVADSIRSAIAQTWEHKEIIVVDDGSTDQTQTIARGFESDNVRVVTQKNQGAAAARNTALSLCHGDYIQWLDADDLLHPDKILHQMAIQASCLSKRTLLSGAFGKFLYRPWRAKFVPTALWHDLSPVDWLLRKMEENVYMQTSTWLVSRELTDAAGPWDDRLLSDDDGEYFCRVLLASDGVRFVPKSKVFYRSFGYDSLSYIGHSAKKCEAHWLSMKLHIQDLRSIEDSPRVHAACLRYLRNCLIYFYPERPDIVQEAEQIGEELGQRLGPPSLSWKYAWMRTVFGWNLAKGVQISMRKTRWQAQKKLDKMLFWIERTKLPNKFVLQQATQSQWAAIRFD